MIVVKWSACLPSVGSSNPDEGDNFLFCKLFESIQNKAVDGTLYNNRPRVAN